MFGAKGKETVALADCHSMLGIGSSLENLGPAVLVGTLGVLLILFTTMSFFRGSQFPVDGKVGAVKTSRSWKLTDLI